MWFLSILSSSLFGWLRAKHIRPRLKIHGAWAFGYCCNIFAIDEPGRHNSSCIMEILAQTMDDATCLYDKTFFAYCHRMDFQQKIIHQFYEEMSSEISPLKWVFFFNQTFLVVSSLFHLHFFAATRFSESVGIRAVSLRAHWSWLHLGSPIWESGFGVCFWGSLGNLWWIFPAMYFVEGNMWHIRPTIQYAKRKTAISWHSSMPWWGIFLSGVPHWHTWEKATLIVV